MTARTIRSSDSVLQTLAWVRKQGFRPVLLHPQSKAAVSKSYPKDDPPDDLWYNGNYGVGVVLGPKAGGPVDVDLDCEEAMFFAPRFLPPTPAVFGRKSKPSSHFLYRVEGALNKVAHNDPVEKKTIIEMRADTLEGSGHQTVFPGSLHETTGELVEWAAVPFPEVPLVEGEVLTKAVRRVALASLLARHVWLPGFRNEPLLPLTGLFFYLDWPLEETQALIQAVMDWAQDDDRTRMRTIALTYIKAEKGGKVTGATTLRKLIKDDRLVDKILELAGSATVNLLNEYNERFAVVNIEGKFRIADTDVDQEDLPVFMQKDDFMNFMGTDVVTVDDKSVPKAKLWLSSPRRRSYRSVDFMPGVEDAGPVLNLWQGWKVAPDASADCRGWTELLKSVICGGDSELIDWMLHWFAGIFQRPMEKPMTSPVLISRPGGGKSLLLRYIGEGILGNNHYTVITNSEQIYGRFNRHLATTLLLHSEEALWGGELQHRGIIKSLITDGYRMFEQKGIDAKQVKNHLRLVLASNYAHAAPAETGDRRFTIIDMEERKISDVLKDKVLAEIKAAGPAGLLDFFMKLKYDHDKVTVNVKNESLANMKGINFTTLESWWFSVLQTGMLLPDYLSWAQRPERVSWTEVVSSSALYQSMLIFAKDRGMRATPNETLYASQLNKFVGKKLRRGQRIYANPMADDTPQQIKQMSGRQNTILNLPDLQACRRAFMLHIGQHVEWGEDLPDNEKPPNEKY